MKTLILSTALTVALTGGWVVEYLDPTINTGTSSVAYTLSEMEKIAKDMGIHKDKKTRKKAKKKKRSRKVLQKARKKRIKRKSRKSRGRGKTRKARKARSKGKSRLIPKRKHRKKVKRKIERTALANVKRKYGVPLNKYEEIIKAAEEAAGYYDLDPKILLDMAIVESRLEVTAKPMRRLKNGALKPMSTATNLMQVIHGTERGLRRQYPSVTTIGGKIHEMHSVEPVYAFALGAVYMKQNTKALKKAGLKPSLRNLYIAHNLDAPKGIKLIKALYHSPNSRIASIIGSRAVRNNPKLYGRTGGRSVRNSIRAIDKELDFEI